jgi:two-component system response regulator FlrC
MKKTVLIVEDDVDTMRYMTSLLRGWGHSVIQAVCGVDALDMIHQNCPDVVISDLIMPGMNGHELLVEIRKLANTCPVTFILLTGYPTVTSVVNAVTEGADEVLLKPLDPERLRTILDTIEKETT